MGSDFSILKKNILLKIAGFNSVYVLIKIVIGAVMSKLIANYAGAAGMAVMGNLRNFTQGIYVFAILGFEHGLIKYASEYRDDSKTLRSYYRTAWFFAFISSVVLAIVVFLSASWLDSFIIATQESYANVFRIIAISLPFYVVLVFITSLLQGYELFKKYISLQIVISLFVFVITAYLLYQYQLTGALYGIALVPFLQCFIAVFFLNSIVKKEQSLKQIIGFDWHKDRLMQMLSYSIMALVSAFLLPMVSILVRNEVRAVVSDVAAGCWEGVLRVSSYYLLFATSLISMYVLPKLSKDDSSLNFRKTIGHFYKTMLPIIIIGLVMVYLMRHWIIELLFNAQFNGMEQLFKWQLIGDFIKIITTVLAFQFIARNDIKKYLIAEIISVLSFYLLSIYLISTNGVEGVVIAHVLNYIIYLLLLLYLLRKELFSTSY